MCMRVCVRVGILLYRKTIIHALRRGGQLRVVNRLMSQSIVRFVFLILFSSSGALLNSQPPMVSSATVSRLFESTPAIFVSRLRVSLWLSGDTGSHYVA